MNMLWGIQIWILLLHCIYLRRWFPCQWQTSRIDEQRQSKQVDGDDGNNIDEEFGSMKVADAGKRRFRSSWLPPWTVWQFWFMLFTHSVYYILELDCTSITTKYVPMGRVDKTSNNTLTQTQSAYHHYLALLVFFAYSTNVNSFSVVALLPFALHNLFWVLGAKSYALLGFYNLTMMFCGFSGMAISVAIYIRNIINRARYKQYNPAINSEAVPCIRASPISFFLPVVAQSIAATNYYTYCRYYSGYACDRHSLFSESDVQNFTIWAVCILFASLTLTVGAGILLGFSKRFAAFLETENSDGISETRYQDGNGRFESGGGRVSVSSAFRLLWTLKIKR